MTSVWLECGLTMAYEWRHRRGLDLCRLRSLLECLTTASSHRIDGLGFPQEILGHTAPRAISRTYPRAYLTPTCTKVNTLVLFRIVKCYSWNNWTCFIIIFLRLIFHSSVADWMIDTIHDVQIPGHCILPKLLHFYETVDLLVSELLNLLVFDIILKNLFESAYHTWAILVDFYVLCFLWFWLFVSKKS